MIKSKFIKKILHFYWRFQRPITLGAFGCVVRADGAVLLVQTRFSSGLSFPGGGVETGESAVDALKRELFEEAGVICLGSPDLFGFYFNPRVSKRDHVAFYIVRDFEMEPRQVPNAEIISIDWVQPRDVSPDPQETHFSSSVRLRFDEVFHETSQQDFWV